MSSSVNFTLKDLVASENLRLHSKAANLNAAFDLIIAKDSRGFFEAPLLVGIDGSVTAGKSFTAKRLFAYLSQRGANCVLVHGDWFMSSRGQRKLEIDKAMRGSYEIANYDATACNFDQLKEVQQQVKGFLYSGDGKTDIAVVNAYNRGTGECDETIHISLSGKPIVIFEGTGISSHKLHEAFDLLIRVDIDSYEEAVKRLQERELEKEPLQRLGPAFVKNRYDLIDYPYDQYLRSRDRKNFDVLIDTSNSNSIKIYKR